MMARESAGWIPLFDSELVDRQPREVRLCLQESENCAANGLWIAASVMLRKALEIAIVLKFQQLEREVDLYEESGREKGLSARLDLLGKSLPAVRRSARDVLVVKWFGDRGAHSTMAVHEGDIRAVIAPAVRSFLSSLGLKP